MKRKAQTKFCCCCSPLWFGSCMYIFVFSWVDYYYRLLQLPFLSSSLILSSDYLLLTSSLAISFLPSFLWPSSPHHHPLISSMVLPFFNLSPSPSSFFPSFISFITVIFLSKQKEKKKLKSFLLPKNGTKKKRRGNQRRKRIRGSEGWNKKKKKRQNQRKRGRDQRRR